MTDAGSGRWPEIHRAYIESSEPVSAICTRFGISTSSLYSRARVENWPRRQRAKRTARPTIVAGNVQNDMLVARLYDTLCQQMKAIEVRLQSMPDIDDNNTTATAERDARTLSTLVRTLEKLIELQAGAAAGARTADDTRTDLDADRFRLEIIRRIEEFEG